MSHAVSVLAAVQHRHLSPSHYPRPARVGARPGVENSHGMVDVTQVVKGVNNALRGCRPDWVNRRAVAPMRHGARVGLQRRWWRAIGESGSRSRATPSRASAHVHCAL